VEFAVAFANCKIGKHKRMAKASPETHFIFDKNPPLRSITAFPNRDACVRDEPYGSLTITFVVDLRIVSDVEASTAGRWVARTRDTRN